MSNGDDQQACCITGGCCGGDDNHLQRANLAEWIRHHIDHPGPFTADEVSAVILDGYDLMVKGHGLAEMVHFISKQARRFPYVS